MSTKASAHLLRASLLLLMFVDPWSVGSGRSSKVVIVLEKTERISQNEARLRVKVTNFSGKPVFSTGIIHDSWPTRLDVYLEYKSAKEGWQLVGPRHDVPVQGVIRLDPAVPVVEETWLKVPLVGSARRLLPDLNLGGQFRYRVDYFGSKREARLYLKGFFANRKDYPQPTSVFSEPFEIPPFRNPPGARPNH